MPPKRRETDAQMKRRVEKLEERKKEWEDGARPLTALEEKLFQPKASSSGRLTRG